MIIPLTKGFHTIIDDESAFLSDWKWHYNDGYAERKENGKHIRLHREIAKAVKGEIVDHINGDTLDNRRENLRFTNHSTNAMNMRKHKGKSVYKGVSKEGKYWRVQIWKDNRKVFSAMAPNERWTAMIYDLNAAVLFGEYARLNFPTALGSKVKTAAALPR